MEMAREILSSDDLQIHTSKWSPPFKNNINYQKQIERLFSSISRLVIPYAYSNGGVYGLGTSILLNADDPLPNDGEKIFDAVGMNESPENSASNEEKSEAQEVQNCALNQSVDEAHCKKNI